jgi:transposase
VRQQWWQAASQVDPACFVFLDESGGKTNMTRLCGRAPSDQRVHAQTPVGHWQTTSMISAISLEGVVASMALPGATDGLAFENYITRLLVPQLKPGQIVVMDNLSAHKRSNVIEAIEAVGCEVWFLPPYSPDLNPIESMWSKVKASLRKLAAPSFEPLIHAIGQALHGVTAADCRGFFEGYGYMYDLS